MRKVCLCVCVREFIMEGFRKLKAFRELTKLKEVEFRQVVSFFPLWLTSGAANIFLFSWKASSGQL